MSLDVFEEDAGILGKMLGLFMHNVPTIVLTITLIISWKRGIVGGIALALAGALYAGLILSKILRDGFEYYYLAWIAQISGAALLIGILFIIDWLKRKKPTAGK